MNNNSTFLQELRAVLIPEKKWHYVFHLVVIVTALFYWIGALVKQPEATWPEIVMYRPCGDNELYPVITALSKFNFGDPTDAVIYGKGIGGHHIGILAPYALAYAILGTRGYMVADAALSWCFFVAMALFLRRCNFGNLSSLLASCALATCGIQSLMGKVSAGFTKLIQFLGFTITDWGFPDLVGLQIFSKRIPRPMVTEIFLVLIFYFLIKVLQQRRLPSWKTGAAVGALMGVILQGDPYSFAAAGLVMGFVLVWVILRNRWRLPWTYGLGFVIGAIATGWFFVLQRMCGNPDLAGRAGLGKFARNSLVPLPGSAPLVRVGVICLFASLLLIAMRRLGKPASATQKQSRKDGETQSSADKSGGGKSLSHSKSQTLPAESAAESNFGRTAAAFCVMLVAAGWLAQPAQVFLLGSGAQIYHYLINTLPAFYAFALFILLYNCFFLAVPESAREPLARFAQRPGLAGSLAVALCLLVLMVHGSEQAIDSITWSKNARQEGGVPWLAFGDKYRPALRALEKEFRENPELKQARTITTFNCEVNFLLTGFYDKRAYTPFMGASGLRDTEVENRLCEIGKLFGLSPEHFVLFVSQHHMMNYWLGAAKYWFASDYKFSTDDDYPAESIAAMKKMPKQSPFVLCMPTSESQRLNQKYFANLSKNTDVKTLPDTIILSTLERNIGLVPAPTLYKQAYTNEAFLVYTKTQ